jgi:hypothetical protein
MSAFREFVLRDGLKVLMPKVLVDDLPREILSRVAAPVLI